MPGPLPDPKRRRRNAPTIPSTNLPVSGRKGRPPKVPDAYVLGVAGAAWWRWAWGLPQATAWDAGSLYVLARRAKLEDDLAVLERVDLFDVGELLGMDPDHEMLQRLEWMIGGLKRLAGGSATIMREMRELDGKLGLNPEALAKLRWTIVDDEAEVQKPARRAPIAQRGPHALRAVDPSAS